MKYIKFTYVDAATGISVASQPARSGPTFPAVPGLQFGFARESAYPTTAPEFFGTCPDTSATQVDGVLAVLTPQEYDAAQARETQDRADALQADVTARTQTRLDTFAQTRGYDGILSACTYATSPTPSFAREGAYCIQARDATWAKLYAILDDVKAGRRPMPSGYNQIEPELPPLAWPL